MELGIRFSFVKTSEIQGWGFWTPQPPTPWYATDFSIQFSRFKIFLSLIVKPTAPWRNIKLGISTDDNVHTLLLGIHFVVG
jgi:hypothetical protein